MTLDMLDEITEYHGINDGVVDVAAFPPQLARDSEHRCGGDGCGRGNDFSLVLVRLRARLADLEAALREYEPRTSQKSDR
jgi:hypothetical protein